MSEQNLVEWWHAVALMFYLTRLKLIWFHSNYCGVKSQRFEPTIITFSKFLKWVMKNHFFGIKGKIWKDHSNFINNINWQSIKKKNPKWFMYNVLYHRAELQASLWSAASFLPDYCPWSGLKARGLKTTDVELPLNCPLGCDDLIDSTILLLIQNDTIVLFHLVHTP